MSYPKEIRKRVESLPQYKDIINKKEKNHLLIKIVSVFIFAFILLIIAYLSGAKTASDIFKNVFLIFFFVNIYDLIVMDIIIFRNVKKFRIPGTEDMDKEYKQYKHHVIGSVIGTIIGLIVSMLAVGYYYLISICINLI